MNTETRLDSSLGRASAPGGRQAGAAREAAGQYRGLAVIRQDNPMSLLADMAEELSWLVNEYEEMSMEDRKSARERMTRRKTGASESSVTLEDLSEEELEALADLLSQKKVTEKSEINTVLARLYREPLHRHAALSRALENLGRDDPELAAALEDLLEELEAAHGPEIRAGYNLAGVPASGLAGGPAELRALYTETVLDCESLTQAMEKLVERYGAGDFPAAAAALFKAVSADISAARPSTDRVRLKVMMDDMYQLEVLGNTYRDCAAFLDKTRAAHPPAPGSPLAGARAEDLMRPVFRLKDEPSVLASQVRGQVPFICGHEDPACDVRLTQGLKNLVRSLPHRIFENQAKRQALLDAVQELVDEAIEREEEMEA